MSAVTNLGKVSVTPKGTWANNTAYDILDIVAYQGSSYIAIQDVPSSGVPLSNTSYWLMIAEKGDGGEITSVSASISGGYGTPGVTVTEGGTDHEKTLAFAFTNLVGKGISSITQTTTSSVSGGTNVITCTLTDGNSTTFAILNGTDGDAINIAPSYDSTATYNLGDLVVYNDTLYECTTAIPVAEAWDSTHWTATDVSDQLSRKANIDGSYDLMNTGTSDNWTPYSADSGATQDIPFINEATGGGNGESVVDTGSYMQAKKKLGNTVGVNQFVPANKINFSGTGDENWWILSDNFSAISGHKYLIFLTGSIPTGSQFRIRDATQSWIGSQHESSFIWTAPGNSTATTALQHNIPTGLAYSINHTIHDLTLWFGSNDRIPSDLLSHPENWGRYYAGSLAYNAGTLESADGSVLTSIGRNVWDEEWENGYITATGAMGSNATSIRSKNYDVCIPNATYHCNNPAIINVCWYDNTKTFISRVDANGRTITAPSNAVYFKISAYGYGATYNNDITLSLYYEGESGYGTYYPFSVLAEVDTGSEPLYGDGTPENSDVKLPSGEITHKQKKISVTAFDGAWGAVTNGYGVYLSLSDIAQGTPRPKMKSNRFVYQTETRDSAKPFEFGGRDGAATTVTFILPSSITSLAEANTWLTNNPTDIIYPVATPTTEQGTAFAENIPCDDFGSLMWTQTKGIPQGNEIFYPVDYKASFDTLYNIVDGDMSAIATDDELQVVADRVPDAPSTDGTYSLKVSVSGGTKTYSWVADE